MNAKNRLWLAILVMTLTMPSFAHNPLREGRESHPAHDNESALVPNLTTARSLLLTFRETGDDRNLEEAWQIVLPALESSTDDPETLMTAAFVAQSRHDFSYALQLTTRALSINPNNDEGWLLLASIHLVRGESDQASKACRQLRFVPALALLTCKARVAVASGDHGIALTRMQGVLSVVDTRRIPTEMLAWSYGVAGDLAVAAGEARQAVELYQHSLGLSERTQVRAALVDVLLNERDYEGAWQSLDVAAPALPLLIRRLIAARRLNRTNEIQAEHANVEREFEVWIANEDWLHAREMTRFFIDVVDRPALARRLALINIGLQQEPEDLLLERRTRTRATMSP